MMRGGQKPSLLPLASLTVYMDTYVRTYVREFSSVPPFASHSWQRRRRRAAVRPCQIPRSGKKGIERKPKEKGSLIIKESFVSFFSSRMEVSSSGDGGGGPHIIVTQASIAASSASSDGASIASNQEPKQQQQQQQQQPAPPIPTAVAVVVDTADGPVTKVGQVLRRR